MPSRRAVLSAKGWHIRKLKLPDERTSLRIHGYVVHANGISVFMGSHCSLFPPPIPVINK